MRVLLVNDRLYPDFIGGVEKRNHDLALELARAGHEVTLAGFGAPPEGLPPGVNVISFGPLGRLYGREGKRSRAQALRYALRAFELDVATYDVVETSNIPYAHVPALALRCALARRPLLVTWYEFWGPYWSEYVSRWIAPLYRVGEWLTAQLGDATVATSRLTADRLAARRWRTGGVDVVPCGIDLNVLGPSLDEPLAPRADLVYAGRLIREKRLGVLLEAMALIPRERRPQLAIYGEGPERGALEAQSERLGLSGRVAFHGHVEGSMELWRRIRAARVAVQPSSREGFGIFPLEAMALGVPVLYCPSPDNAVEELVRDGIEGIAVEAEPAALAGAIERMMCDGGLRSRLGHAGEVRARDYGLERIGSTAAAILGALARRAASRATSDGSTAVKV